MTSGHVKFEVLDLQRSGHTLVCHTEFSPDSGAALMFIPPCCANGLETSAVDTTVNFAQEQDFDSTDEAGVQWNSF